LLQIPRGNKLRETVEAKQSAPQFPKVERKYSFSDNVVKQIQFLGEDNVSSAAIIELYFHQL